MFNYCYDIRCDFRRTSKRNDRGGKRTRKIFPRQRPEKRKAPPVPDHPSMVSEAVVGAEKVSLEK